jgi:diguanylate cyclase (GGDEF)-like protein
LTKSGKIKEFLFGSPVRRDLWGIALACLLVFTLAGEYDAFEEIHEFSRAHEDWDLDEAFSVLAFLPFALLYFVLRRYKELQVELQLRKQAEESAHRLAHFDPLTGVLNRSLLEFRLAQAMARSRRKQSSLAVFFIDLDGFKQINDKHGHAVGDEFLCEIARRIQKCVREQDSVVRMGGDEFLVLLDEVDAVDQIPQVAQRLIDEIRKPWCLNDATLSVSASIGISVFSGFGLEIGEHLVRQSDRAMYQAKSEGKNRFVFFADVPVEGVEYRHQSGG